MFESVKDLSTLKSIHKTPPIFLPFLLIFRPRTDWSVYADFTTRRSNYLLQQRAPVETRVPAVFEHLRSSQLLEIRDRKSRKLEQTLLQQTSVVLTSLPRIDRAQRRTAPPEWKLFCSLENKIFRYRVKPRVNSASWKLRAVRTLRNPKQELKITLNSFISNIYIKHSFLYSNFNDFISYFTLHATKDLIVWNICTTRNNLYS